MSAAPLGVFINCPFDDDYRPILEAVLFCVIDSGLVPRIATERMDSGEVRLDKIVEIIAQSDMSIHDLSRLRIDSTDSVCRMNMPFELGMAYGFWQGREVTHPLLVMASDRYLYQQALSDIAGWDTRAHLDRFDEAIRRVRAWLSGHLGEIRSASVILGDYVTYQEWDWERLLDIGWDEDDIMTRETPELLRSMTDWVTAGRPATWPPATPLR